MKLDRELPHDDTCEMALIGAVLWDVTCLPTVAGRVKPEDFYDPDRGKLWAAALACMAQYGQSFDLSLYAAQIAKDPPSSINVENVRQWMTSTGGAACAPYYARIIADHARTRRAISAYSESSHDLLTADNPAEALARAVERMAEIDRNAVLEEGQQLSEVMAEVIVKAGTGGAEMIPTGIEAFDQNSDGLPKSGVLTVVGYPGSGKSTFTLICAAQRAMRHLGKQPVRLYSIEMHAHRIAATLLTNATGIAVHAVMDKGGSFTQDQEARLGAVALDHEPCNIWLAPRIYAAPDIYAQCAAAHAVHGPACVVVDYLQDLPGFDIFKEERVRIAESMRILASIARDFGWLVIVVSQLDKQTGKLNRRPTMFDGIGSAAIEQRSDMMISIWREHQQEPRVLNKDENEWILRKRKVEIAVLKRKYGMSMPTLLSFDGAKMQYTNPTEEEYRAWEH